MTEKQVSDRVVLAFAPPLMFLSVCHPPMPMPMSSIASQVSDVTVDVPVQSEIDALRKIHETEKKELEEKREYFRKVKPPLSPPLLLLVVLTLCLHYLAVGR